MELGETGLYTWGSQVFGGSNRHWDLCKISPTSYPTPSPSSTSHTLRLSALHFCYEIFNFLWVEALLVCHKTMGYNLCYHRVRRRPDKSLLRSFLVLTSYDVLGRNRGASVRKLLEEAGGLWAWVAREFWDWEKPSDPGTVRGSSMQGVGSIVTTDRCVPPQFARALWKMWMA